MEEVMYSNMSKVIYPSPTVLRDITESITELTQRGVKAVSKDVGQGSTIILDKNTGRILTPTTAVKPDLQRIINKYLKNN